MNIDQLNYVRYAVELGSYARAARLLRVTPQAISKAVVEAERLCGQKIMARKGRGVEATPFGEVFAYHARIISTACDDLRALVHLWESRPRP